MPARQEREAESAFRALMQEAVSVLMARRDEQGSLRHLLLHPEARLNSAHGPMEMRVAHSYLVLPDPDGGFRVSTAGYHYDVAELGEGGRREEIFGYHWHPRGVGSDTAFPHLHVYGQREIGERHLSKLHLPTGRVSLGSFIRLLITELDVTPLKEDWAQTLDRTEDLSLRSHGP